MKDKTERRRALNRETRRPLPSCSGHRPHHQEQARGLLRVYGRGEGYDNRGPAERLGGDDGGGAADYGSLPDLTDDRDAYSDFGSSPSPQGSDWGQLGGMSPASTTEISYKSSTLTADGNPDFSEARVREYLQSF